MNKPTIITLSGKARNGKDSTATLLKNKLEKLNKKSLIIAYADHLKHICQKYYNWDGNKDEFGRSLLQSVGSQVREKNQGYWVNTVIDFVEVFGDNYDFVLIPDTRYLNEILQWEYDGYDIIPIHITRTNFHNGLTKEQQQHKSEVALDNFNFDYYIQAEDLNGLEAEVNKFVNKLKEDGYI